MVFQTIALDSKLYEIENKLDSMNSRLDSIDPIEQSAPLKPLTQEEKDRVQGIIDRYNK